MSVDYSPESGRDFISGSHDGLVRVWDSVLANNMARRGAAANVSGGLLIFVRSALTDNTASEQGGALAVSAGSVLLLNQSVLEGNTAPHGASMLIEGAGIVAYGLPAPLGHWLVSPYVCDSACQTAWTGVPDIVGLTITTLESVAVEDEFPLYCRTTEFRTRDLA